MPELKREPATPLDLALAAVRPVTDSIWGALAHLPTDTAPARIMFLGAGAEAGTTTLAAATALGLARNTHLRVNLVEMNVARPALAEYLGLSFGGGLSDVLDKKLRIEECLLEVREARGLFVLPGGAARAPVAGELSTDFARELWQRLGVGARYLLFDAPPLVHRPEGRLLLEDVDAALLVVRSGETLRKDARQTAEILKASGVPLLGTIVNAYRSELRFAAG